MGTVLAISSIKDQKKALQDVRKQIYESLPGWHRPPMFLELDRFDRRKEPFWSEHIGQTFVHEQDGRVNGRITVFVPNTPATVGHFGAFDCIHDEAICDRLLGDALKWLAARGVTRVEGPYFLTIHEEVGLLTSGFETPSAILMPYNPGYYHELLARAGFTSVRRFLTYRYDLASNFDAVTRNVRAIGKFDLRPFDMKDIRHEAQRLLSVYNDAFAENWGFEPLNAEQGERLIGGLLRVGDPTLVRIAEHEGEVAGFILCVPDINGYLHSIREYPEIARRVALAWSVARRRIRDCRVITLAVRKTFQGRALSRLLVDSLASAAREAGYRNAELSYVDSENRQMKRLMTGYEFSAQKEYQVYSRTVGKK